MWYNVVCGYVNPDNGSIISCLVEDLFNYWDIASLK